MTRVAGATTVDEATAAARSRLYRLLADGFAYPDRDLFGILKTSRYRDDTAETCRILSDDLEPALDGLVASGEYTDFQAEYLRLFEVGLGIPPCPLYGGIYRGGRKAVMEELIRFYNFFGLSVEQGAGELPDHLTTELEFMHFLAFKELAALQRKEDATPYRRAQADFLERQLASWLPALDARLQGLGSPPFYAALISVTSAVVQGELASLRRTVEAAETAIREA